MSIVVLDDSNTVLMTMGVLLGDLGVQEQAIHFFEEGHKALEYIEAHGADIIFSDINMPGMNGFEFVEKLLDVSKKFVPTLFVVSADETDSAISHMKRIGAKRFIRKPISAKHFNHFVAPEINKVKSRLNEPAVAVVTESVSEEVLSISGNIDYEKLAQEIGIKAKHLPKLMQSFVDESRELIDKLREAIEFKDFAQIQKCAHSLKGSSGNMHFYDISDICRDLELAGKEEDGTFDFQSYENDVRRELLKIKL